VYEREESQNAGFCYDDSGALTNTKVGPIHPFFTFSLSFPQKQKKNKKQSMSLLFLVQELNNLGIQALELHDYERALEFFRHALYQAKANIQSHRQESAIPTATYNNNNNTNNGSSRPSERFKSTTMMMTTTTTSSTTFATPTTREEIITLVRSTNLARKCLAESAKNEGENPSTLQLLCTRGLCMLDTSTTATVTPSFSHNSVEEANIHCAMVIFNVGLVFQRSAAGPNLQWQRQQQQRVAEHLQQSKTLYYQAYRLLAPIMEESFQGHSSGNALLDLLYLAVLHNWLQASTEAATASETTQDQTCAMTHSVSDRLIRMARSVGSSTYYSRRSDDRSEGSHWLEEEEAAKLPLLRSLAELCLVNASTFRLNPRDAAAAA
jgi:hypothetical protein